MLIDLFKLFILIKYINISNTKILVTAATSTLTKYTYMYHLVNRKVLAILSAPAQGSNFKEGNFSS